MSEYSAHRPILNGTTRLSKTHKEYEKNEFKERRKSLLHLILGYLRDCNLHETAGCLISEAQLSDQFVICDNIDLDIVLQDYQSYYYAKFNKAPKIIRKVSAGSEGDIKLTPPRRKPKVTNSSPSLASSSTQLKTTNENPSNITNFQIDVTNLSSQKEDQDATSEKYIPENESITLCDHPGYTPEWRELAELITKEIVPKKKGLGVGWDDCVGVREGVELLKEAAVYPLMYPDLFTGLLTPWKGILLYGPPGTGKTLLAKALACETSTFINLTISTFVSKWRGDSEKLLKVLFDVARLYAPTTIFIDELDAIASKFEDSQHDASRRFRSELLVQLDGLMSGDNKIFVLATTNCPWNLNNAILRRFEKRILLNVPDPGARTDLFKHYFNKQGREFCEEDFRCMAQNTDNFSGADIKLVVKEVFMSALRDKLRSGQIDDKVWRRDPVTRIRKKDVMEAIQKFNPTCGKELAEKYKDWAKSNGSL